MTTHEDDKDSIHYDWHIQNAEILFNEMGWTWKKETRLLQATKDELSSVDGQDESAEEKLHLLAGRIQLQKTRVRAFRESYEHYKNQMLIYKLQAEVAAFEDELETTSVRSKNRPLPAVVLADAPNPDHYNLRDHWLVGKEEFRTVVSIGCQWCAIACHLCGANANGHGVWFKGFLGLKAHLWHAHRDVIRPMTSLAWFGYVTEHCKSSVYSQLEVKLMLNGGCRPPVIKYRNPRKVTTARKKVVGKSKAAPVPKKTVKAKQAAPVQQESVTES